MGRSLLRGGVAFIGTAFAVVCVLVFLPPVLADIHTGTAVLFTADIDRGITWSHAYGLHDQPLYYSLSLLEDVTGIVAFAGTGLLLLYAAARRAPAADGRARARVLGTPWALVCILCAALHWALVLFPYLLRGGYFPELL